LACAGVVVNKKRHQSARQVFVEQQFHCACKVSVVCSRLAA
jgi:hypothetical protein